MLMQRRGVDDAPMVAAQTADEFQAKGDKDGYEIWKAIVDAILEPCLSGFRPQGLIILRHDPLADPRLISTDAVELCGALDQARCDRARL